MPRDRLELLYQLTQMVATSPDQPSDRSLLDRYVGGRDEEAFALLVRRYGGLVWGTCRRVLHDDHDAEDVFQATFLVLAKKARSIRRAQSLGGWLYRIAYRMALRVRANAERRQRLARSAPARPTPDPLAEVSGRELLRRLDAELQQLPDHLRAPLLLCCLEGQSQEEAAARLGWSKATLRGRLERGRERLRRRLSRLGLPASALLFPAALTAAAAGHPEALAAATARAAVLVADGAPHAASPAVLVLARTASRALLISRLRPVAVLVLFAALGSGAAALSLRTVLQGAAVPPDNGAVRADPKDAAAAPATLDRHGDPVPPDALARLGSGRLRHAGRVVGVTYAADGKCAFSTGTDGRTVLWDAATGRELRQYVPGLDAEAGRELRGESLALAPDGRTLAVGYENAAERIRLFDVGSGKELFRLKGHPACVSSLAFTPDGKRLVSGGGDDKVHVWDTTSGRELRPWVAGGPGRRLALSPDGRTVATGGDDRTVYLGDAASGRVLHKLEGHPDRVTSLTFAPDGRTLVSGAANDPLLRLWDVASGRAVRTLKADGPVAYSPDGTLLAAGGGLRMILVWNAATGQELRRFAGHKHDVSALAFAPDGRTLVSGGLDGTVRFWDPTAGTELSADLGHEDGINAVAFSPDGTTVVTGGDDSTTRFWDPATGRPLRRHDRAEYDFVLPGKPVPRAHNPRAIFALAFLPGARQLAVGGYQICQLVDPETGKRQVGFDMGRDVNLSRLAVAPDGKTVAWTSRDRVRLCDAADGKLRHQLPDHRAFVRTIAFTPDGKQLATACDDKTGLIRLWDCATGAATREIRSQNTQVLALAFAPDGATLAVGGSEAGVHREETFIEIWDLATSRERRQFKGRHDAATSLAFSPDGTTLAAAAFTELHLWEVATGGRRGRFTHAGGINALAFGPDGRSVVTAGRDSTALVWDLTGGRRAAAPVAREEWEAAWADLAGEDPGRGYRALWTLAAAPQTVAALRERLKPLTPQQAAQLERWVADLDGEDFATRQRAEDALQRQGHLAEPALRLALAGEPPLELRRRVERLLERLATPSADRLRESRAVEALGHAPGPEAQRLLEAWARGAATDRLTREARAALVVRCR